MDFQWIEEKKRKGLGRPALLVVLILRWAAVLVDGMSLRRAALLAVFVEGLLRAVSLAMQRLHPIAHPAPPHLMPEWRHQEAGPGQG